MVGLYRNQKVRILWDSFFRCGLLKKKSILNLLQKCFGFMFWHFGPKAYRVLARQPRIEPTSPTLEGEVLTNGP